MNYYSGWIANLYQQALALGADRVSAVGTMTVSFAKWNMPVIRTASTFAGSGAQTRLAGQHRQRAHRDRGAVHRSTRIKWNGNVQMYHPLPALLVLVILRGMNDELPPTCKEAINACKSSKSNAPACTS